MSLKNVFCAISIYVFFCLPAYSQVNVAVSDFLNKSDVLFLDAWERSVPELIRSEFSSYDNIVVLDRNKLDKVLEEQALSLSGLAESDQAQSIGKLLDADFILSGSIDKQNDEFVISADLVRVKTGEVQTEIVRSRNKDYKNQMVDMLVNNILYRLTGEGDYSNEVVFKSNSIWYWAGATILLGSATILTNNYYRESQDNYNNTTQLKKFDTYYDNANTSKNIVIGLATATGGALIGTFIDLFSGDETNKIKSGRSQGVSAHYNINYTGTDEIRISLCLNF